MAAAKYLLKLFVLEYRLNIHGIDTACPDCPILQRYASLKAVLHFHSKPDSFVTIRNASAYCCSLLPCCGFLNLLVLLEPT